MTLCDRESLPISTYNPTYDLRLSLETQSGLPLNLASEDSAVDSGLKAVSLLE